MLIGYPVRGKNVNFGSPEKLSKVDIRSFKIKLQSNEPPSRYTIHGYSVINQQNHRKYGIITYARNPDQIIDLGGSTEENGTQRTTIKVGDTEITNMYKRPSQMWKTHIAHSTHIQSRNTGM